MRKSYKKGFSNFKRKWEMLNFNSLRCSKWSFKPIVFQRRSVQEIRYFCLSSKVDKLRVDICQSISSLQLIETSLNLLKEEYSKRQPVSKMVLPCSTSSYSIRGSSTIHHCKTLSSISSSQILLMIIFDNFTSWTTNGRSQRIQLYLTKRSNRKKRKVLS